MRRDTPFAALSIVALFVSVYGLSTGNYALGITAGIVSWLGIAGMFIVGAY